MRLGVVVPCHRQERHLPRTLAALGRALEGRDWQGVVVRTGGGPAPEPHPQWLQSSPPALQVSTPGASRMHGLSLLAGEWILFVDADTEVDAAWLARALATATAAEAGLAGVGGRLEEWNEVAGAERCADPDMNRVGDAEREVPLLTTPVLYRRAALEAVGGYDVRLSAEEDFELGMRLGRSGYRLRVVPGPAARHWNDPRPSFAELARRWRSGLAFGPGQALRLYVGRPGFARLAARQWFAWFALVFWLAGGVALVASLASRSPLAVAAWSAALLLMLLALAFRKRSARLGLHAWLAWTLGAAGLVAGFLGFGGARTAAQRTS
ncbi:MAG: glycosyltransferase [Candidatus Eisenbacteria bacterium]|uniref:Glycosyltransferase n=1 Tax=Eiseniibacteriota bacterium TaxID=2212470 RepID=A0A849SXB8_UNCEI|nr:glycosyltransferase [Candidatus Eisenbacteria bacterium]